MGMVENIEKKTPGMTELQRCEIRRLRHYGLSMSAIGARFGVDRQRIGRAIEAYDLDTPPSPVELVRLELLAAFMGTSGRLAEPGLTSADHAKLCALQVRQGAALRKIAQEDETVEDMGMSKRSEAERARLDRMNTEELRNEIRRLAGLELKALEPSSGRGVAGPVDEISGTQRISVSRDGSATPTDG